MPTLQIVVALTHSGSVVVYECPKGVVAFNNAHFDTIVPPNDVEAALEELTHDFRFSTILDGADDCQHFIDQYEADTNLPPRTVVRSHPALLTAFKQAQKKFEDNYV